MTSHISRPAYGTDFSTILINFGPTFCNFRPKMGGVTPPPTHTPPNVRPWTQEIFEKLVGDVVAQDDDTVNITNMRTAVKNTNVVLNLAIMPGIILIPSDLLILKQKIPGYNNTLTLATKDMNFGENSGVNYNETKVDDEEETTTSEESSTLDTSSIVVNIPPDSRRGPKLNKELGILFTALSIIGIIGARFLL